MDILRRGLAAVGRGMGRSSAASPVAVAFLALAMAALVAFFVTGESNRAHGLATETSTPIRDDLRILEKIVRDTRVADAARARGEIPTASMEEAQVRAQRVMTRSMRSAYLKPVAPVGGGAATGTSITLALMRAGLAGAAVGIWVHNGIMIYNGIKCGEADCPHPIRLDARFLNAGRAGTMVTRDRDNNVTGAMILTRYEWDHRPVDDRVDFRAWYVVDGRPDIGGLNTRVVASQARNCDGFNYTNVYADVTSLRWANPPYANYV